MSVTIQYEAEAQITKFFDNNSLITYDPIVVFGVSGRYGEQMMVEYCRPQVSLRSIWKTGELFS